MLSAITPPAQVARAAARADGVGAAGDAALHVDGGASPAPSPRLSLDHATGLVVIEFRGSHGRVGQSFPTDREMEAYRRNLVSQPTGGAGSASPASGSAASRV